MKPDKSRSNSKIKVQDSMYQKQITQTSIIYNFNRIPEVHQYLSKSDYLSNLKQKYKDIKTQLRSKQLQIKNISNQSSKNQIREQIKKKLFRLDKMTLSNQNLNNIQYKTYFGCNSQIKQMLKFFKLRQYVDDKIQLYYLKSISEQGILKKKYQLQGYKKETLIINCSELSSFQLYQKQNDTKLPLILQCIKNTLRQDLQELASCCKLNLVDLDTQNNNQLFFTVIGFKKYYINFYDALIDVFCNLKTFIRLFDKRDQQRQINQLMRIIQKQNKKQSIDAKIIYTQGYIIMIGDDALPQNIQLFINSSTRKIQYSFRTQQGQKVCFIKQNIDIIRKLITQQVNYVDGTLKLQQLTIKTDNDNYSKCVQIISNFIRQKMKLKQQFYFNEQYHKQIFLKYFKDQMKIQIQKQNNKDKQKIVFYASQSNVKYILEQLGNKKYQIESKTQKILVDANSDKIKDNKRVNVSKKYQQIEIGCKSNCVILQNISIEVSNRIEIQNSDCIICCYKPEQQLFLDNFISPLLGANTKSCITKVMKKIKLPSLHRIAQTFCSNLIIHKFNLLSNDEVIQDFDKIFAQIKEQITNISIVVPQKYKYHQNYLQDFVIQLLDKRKQFIKLKRIIVVCQTKSRDHIRQLIKKYQYNFKIRDKRQISVINLLKHQNLSFYDIKFQKSNGMEMYQFTPMLLSILHQHILFQTQKIILIIPYKHYKNQQYLVNLSDKSIINSKTKQQITSKQFKQDLKCLNSILKQNSSRRKEYNHYYHLMTVYVSNKQILGDYFELDTTNKILTKLKNKFQKTTQQFKFQIQQKSIVKAHIVQSYQKQIESMIELLKFGSQNQLI